MYSFFNTLLYKSFYTGVLEEKSEYMFLQLHNHYHLNDSVHTGMFLSVMSQILYSIMEVIEFEYRKCAEDSEKAAGEHRKPYSPKGVPLEILYQINELLTAKYAEDITPTSLSKQFFMSAKQINRYIYNQYGQTFLQRRTELRMITAQKLLADTDEPITKVSETVGYKSINTFYSAFKAFCGTTPDAYRREVEFKRKNMQ